MYFLFAFALFFACRAACARACTTVVAGKNATQTGHVIVGHNEDDAGRIVNRHGYVPAASHVTGEVLEAEAGSARVPQVSHTHGFYWSEMKRTEGGLSNADTFYNDAGVLIVSNSCGKSRVDMDDASLLSEGGIGYNLRRCLAERASSAREAVEIAASLLDRYGYTGSGRSYVLADADEAWVLQIARGKHYAARRVSDGETAFIPNWYTIREVDTDDRENWLVSPGLIEYARAQGWYSPEQGKFDFARAYQAPEQYMGPGSRFRCAGAWSILTRSPFWRDDRYPFALRLREPLELEHVMEVLRSHYAGSVADPAYMRAALPGGSPHRTGMRRICTGTTVESTVTVFGNRDRPDLTTMWTSFGRPCELPYLPLHPFFGFPAPCDAMGVDAAKMLAEHCRADESLSGWHKNAWQEFRDFQALFELFYEEHFAAHERAVWSFERALKLREEKTQARAAENPDRAAKIFRAADEEVFDCALGRIREWNAPLAAQTSTVGVRTDGGEAVLTFSLEDGRVPQEELLCAIWGDGNPATEGARPVSGSLCRTSGGWTVRFALDDLRKAGSDGTFDFYLCGREQFGRSFGGKFFIAL